MRLKMMITTKNMIWIKPLMLQKKHKQNNAKNKQVSIILNFDK